MKGCNRQPAVFWLWHSSTHTHTLPHTHTHYLSFSISLSQSAVMQLTGPEMLMRVQWRVGERGWGRGTETLKTKNSIKSCARHSPIRSLTLDSLASNSSSSESLKLSSSVIKTIKTLDSSIKWRKCWSRLNIFFFVLHFRIVKVHLIKFTCDQKNRIFFQISF